MSEEEAEPKKRRPKKHRRNRNYSQFRLNQSSDGTDPITPKLKF